MTPLYLSRATLKSSPDIDALARTLAPDDPGARLQTDHRLVWSLFAGDRDAERDFLFRREDASRARFLILSRRRPHASSPIFDVETKDFAPTLMKGERLGFSLFANPAVTHWREVNGKKTRRRDDVVMHALSKVPKEERAAMRPEIIAAEGRAWLEAQGQAAGFAIDKGVSLKVDGYDQFDIDRRGSGARGKRSGGKAISVSVLSFDGFLTVEEPEIFLRKLGEGFGRSRAFGCGLMLIRRPRA